MLGGLTSTFQISSLFDHSGVFGRVGKEIYLFWKVIRESTGWVKGSRLHIGLGVMIGMRDERPETYWVNWAAWEELQTIDTKILSFAKQPLIILPDEYS